MAERNIELALEGPQLVQAFNLEMKVVVADGNIDHVLKTMIDGRQKKPAHFAGQASERGNATGRFTSIVHPSCL